MAVSAEQNAGIDNNASDTAQIPQMSVQLGISKAKELQASVDEYVEIGFVFNQKSQSYYGGYILDPSLTEAKQLERMTDAMLSMFQDIQKETKRYVLNNKSLLSANDMRAIIAEVQEIDEIKKVIGSGDGRFVSEVSIKSQKTSASEDLKDESEMGLPAAAPSEHRWWPYQGSVSTGDNGTGRYVNQLFRWGTSQLDELKRYGSVAYEAEFWSNNYDRLQYLGDMVIVWSSTMKYSVLDTEISNTNNNELGYTVLTTYVQKLEPLKYYNTYILASYGDAGSDSGKINGQMGQKLFPGCHWNPWCVIQSIATQRLVPAWQVPIPGFKAWSN